MLCIKRHRAFTLVELLVVISIIALLIGLLLPVLGSARASARAMVCMTNIRSLSQAAVMFSHDNDGAFPQPASSDSAASIPNLRSHYPAVRISTLVPTRSFGWFVSLDEYLGLDSNLVNDATFAYEEETAEFKQDPVWGDLEHDDTGPGRVNYTLKMNSYFGRPGGLNNAVFRVGTKTFGTSTTDATLRVTYERNIERPSKMVMFFDGIADDITQGQVSDSIFGKTFRGSSAQRSSSEIGVGLRHDGGANVGFADGSASYVKQETRKITADNGDVIDTWFFKAAANGFTGDLLNKQELEWIPNGTDMNGSGDRI